eukprot:GHVS01104993.1.p1 GENE.GHVS01104993.1~~GHVS01104993.1.p1  ORF type:complete len:481 (-),score=73.01 GHVS01104993.1:221-1663(-)
MLYRSILSLLYVHPLLLCCISFTMRPSTMGVVCRTSRLLFSSSSLSSSLSCSSLPSSSSSSSSVPRCCCFSSSSPQPMAVADVVKRTFNPIRNIVDRMQVKPAVDKPLLQLSIGDPTVYGNFRLPLFANEKLREKLDCLKHNGYPSSVGTVEARTAVAAKFGPTSHPVKANDVVLTCGCSQALDLAFATVANPNSLDNILLPQPGFCLYETLLTSKGIAHSYYNLQPAKQWEVDLQHLEQGINENTKAILVNNPSNPTGAVYSKEHLLAILEVARKHNVIIISDEIYANMAFAGHSYYSLASLSDDVPILETGGISKQYMVPGWRLGWVIAHDRNDRLSLVLAGLVSLSQLTLGPCSIIQSVLPELLLLTPPLYYQETMVALAEHAQVVCDKLKNVEGLEVMPPQGAMYAMVRVDVARLGFESDVDFAAKLLEEEGLFVLPGQCFRLPGFIRLVITSPIDKLIEAMSRLRQFCESRSSRQ